MQLRAAHATFRDGDPARNARDAARKIRADFAGLAPAQVFFFAGAPYDGAVLAAAMKDAFPGAVTLGCSTSGEIADGVMRHGSVAALAAGPDVFTRFSCRLLRRLDGGGRAVDPRAAVEEAFASFGAEFGRDVGELDETRHVGLALADGNPYFIEPVMDRVGDLTPVTFVGALAGDDGALRHTPVFYDGGAFTDAALLAFARPAASFGLVKTQGLAVTDRVFEITRADERERLVRELDGRPAAEVYAEAVGVPATRMDLEGVFSHWPFGLMVGDEPFLRVATAALPDGSLRFWPAVREGQRLSLARPEGIVPSTAKALDDIRGRLGSIGGLLHFNCMSRHHQLRDAGELEAFGNLFRGFPNAGFSSHGEIYIAIANQTSTMLVFA